MNAYEEKQTAKRERYQELAEKHEQAAEARHNSPNMQALRGMQGEPVKIGHHSEKRHRKLFEKVDKDMEKAHEHMKKAEYYRDKAQSVGKSGISSDDPEALQKLKDKLEKLKLNQEVMKGANRIVRSKKKSDDEKIQEIREKYGHILKPDNIPNLLKPDFAGRTGFPDYALQNNKANIKRTEKRIAEMEMIKNKPANSVKIGDTEIRDNPELNRTQVFFPVKPEKHIRDELKAKGFRWSKANKCWQRHLSNQAMYWAKYIAEKYRNEL